MNLPINTAHVSFVCAGAPRPYLDFQTKQQRFTDDGRPINDVNVMFIEGDEQFTLKVRTACDPKGLRPGQAVVVTGVTARPYTLDNKTNVTFWADTVEPAKAPGGKEAA